MALKLILNGKFLTKAGKETFLKIKETSGLSSISYDPNIILEGGKDQILKAVKIIAEADIIQVDFSDIGDDFRIKTIKTAMRDGKERRLDSLIKKSKLPSCYANMIWRFTTPRTTKEQDQITADGLSACAKCDIFDKCFAHSVLKKLEEKKWLEE